MIVSVETYERMGNKSRLEIILRFRKLKNNIKRQNLSNSRISKAIMTRKVLLDHRLYFIIKETRMSRSKSSSEINL